MHLVWISILSATFLLLIVVFLDDLIQLYRFCQILGKFAHTFQIQYDLIFDERPKKDAIKEIYEDIGYDILRWSHAALKAEYPDAEKVDWKKEMDISAHT